MTTVSLTLSEIRVRGFEALLRELGAAGAIRFIQQYESGRGDYTRDRRSCCTKRACVSWGRRFGSRRGPSTNEETNQRIWTADHCRRLSSPSGTVDGGRWTVNARRTAFPGCQGRGLSAPVRDLRHRRRG